MAKQRKPQLSNQEVALIKAMLKTGNYKRQEILTYFSRKDRPVNLGRISEIATGKKRTEVQAASAADLADFLKNSDNPTASNAIRDPMSDLVLDGLFKLKSKRPKALAVAESETVEFKQSFNWKHRPKYARTLAGFANHNGGYLLFGISDDGRVMGIDEDIFLGIDQSKITQFLNSYFQPQIYWQRKVYSFGNKQVGILRVEPCVRKPAICTKTSPPLKEGEIYY